MESAMTFRQGVSGNPHGNRHRTRHLLNQEFMQALLLHFRQHGKQAIEKVAREQPASYLKILGLLVPREHKVEHPNLIKELTDEQLEAMIEHIKTSLEAQADGPVKVIEGMIEPTTVPATALPVLEPPKRKPNRLMMEVDTAIGPQERKPRKLRPTRGERSLPYRASSSLKREDLSVSRDDPAPPWSVPPKVLEPVGRHFGVPDGVLDVLVPEVVLQGPCVMAVVGQLEPAGMAEHVWVDRKWHLGGLPEALDEPVEADGADWHAELGNEP